MWLQKCVKILSVSPNKSPIKSLKRRKVSFSDERLLAFKVNYDRHNNILTVYFTGLINYRFNNYCFNAQLNNNNNSINYY